MRRNSVRCLTTVSALESRQLLAGNVQAELINGEVTITGDRSKNEINLFSDGSGLHVVAVNGTKLNGVANSEVVFAVADNVVIDLLEGNDILSVGSFVGGSLSVQMGSGSDVAAFSAVTITAGFNLDGGTGGDFLSLDDDNGPNTLTGLVFLLGGDGNDLIQNVGSAITGNFTIVGGKGNDSLGWAQGSATQFSFINGGEGGDKIAVTNVTVTEFIVESREGNDLVGVKNSTFTTRAKFDLGAGKDALLTNGNTFAAVDRQGGDGTDSLFGIGDSITNGGDDLTSGFELFPTNVTSLVQKLTNVFPFFV